MRPPSPAVRLNRSRVPTGPAPQGPIRAPRWVRISTGSTARWHDHRTHWMGGATPAAVRRDPDRAHVVGHWRIPLRVDGRATGIDGVIRWDPPPTAWAWCVGGCGCTHLRFSGRGSTGADAPLQAGWMNAGK